MDDDLIVWNDSYSVGNETIDNQHKGLVAMANELLLHCRQKGPEADVAFARTVKKAMDYARSHFSTEENIMTRSSYPDIQTHKKEHEKFVIDILKAIREFEDGKIEPINLVEFLKNWLLNHIAETDKKCAPYFSKC